MSSGATLVSHYKRYRESQQQEEAEIAKQQQQELGSQDIKAEMTDQIPDSTTSDLRSDNTYDDVINSVAACSTTSTAADAEMPPPDAMNVKQDGGDIKPEVKAELDVKPDPTMMSGATNMMMGDMRFDAGMAYGHAMHGGDGAAARFPPDYGAGGGTAGHHYPSPYGAYPPPPHYPNPMHYGGYPPHYPYPAAAGAYPGYMPQANPTGYPHPMMNPAAYGGYPQAPIMPGDYPDFSQASAGNYSSGDNMDTSTDQVPQLDGLADLKPDVVSSTTPHSTENDVSDSQMLIDNTNSNDVNTTATTSSQQPEVAMSSASDATAQFSPSSATNESVSMKPSSSSASLNPDNSIKIEVKNAPKEEKTIKKPKFDLAEYFSAKSSSSNSPKSFKTENFTDDSRHSFDSGFKRPKDEAFKSGVKADVGAGDADDIPEDVFDDVWPREFDVYLVNDAYKTNAARAKTVG